jgi:acid phosphatase
MPGSVLTPHRVLLSLGALASLVVAGCSSGTRSAAGTTSTAAVRTTAVSTSSSGASSSSTVGVGPPEHVVVVIEENRAAAEVLGRADAPYINQLASEGALLTQSFAVAHPSEPNYLALFSGSTHGLSDDSCPPHGSPYHDANLATALAAVGKTFVTYAESLPSAGSLACSAGSYARKHNPVTDFSNVPGTANQPFSAFPSDYSSLPSVAFVVPNLDHDMHDGSVAQADQWLRSNLGAYVTWARTHDSLLLVTWDEDDYSADNHIATIVVGAKVDAGRDDQRIDHYGVLATVCHLFGAAPPGQAANAAPLTLFARGG